MWLYLYVHQHSCIYIYELHIYLFEVSLKKNLVYVIVPFKFSIASYYLGYISLCIIYCISYNVGLHFLQTRFGSIVNILIPNPVLSVPKCSIFCCPRSDMISYSCNFLYMVFVYFQISLLTIFEIPCVK